MAEATFSLDLHVLGPPLTFALSQDQTLHRKFLNLSLRRLIGRPPGGRYPCDVELVSVTQVTETQIFSICLLSSFQRPIPTRTGPRRTQRRRRRGMLLILGWFSLVNLDRRFFRRHHQPLLKSSNFQANSPGSPTPKTRTLALWLPCWNGSATAGFSKR